MRFISVLTTALLLFTIPLTAQVNNDSLKIAADNFAKSYNAKEYDGISTLLDDEVKKQLTPGVLKQVFDAQHEKLGKVLKVGEARPAGDAAAFFLLTFEKGESDLILSMAKNGKLNGIRLVPPKPKSFLTNKISMRLPFDGEWFVVWGGDTTAQNYHQDFPNQRFAFDFLKVDEKGKTHKGDGKRNEDYYAFGQRIVAPSDGVVTDVVDGVRDNVPGVMNPLMALGNNIVIKHAEGEYSAFAHFKQNTIAVKAGQTVKKGQLLGLSGNSGNSSEAHLHFQVQKGPLFENEGSKKVFFVTLMVIRDSVKKFYDRISPVKGDRISSLEPETVGPLAPPRQNK